LLCDKCCDRSAAKKAWQKLGEETSPFFKDCAPHDGAQLRRSAPARPLRSAGGRVDYEQNCNDDLLD